MADRIETSAEIKAPIARVWRALTDHREFGQWFRVRLEGPFAVGQVSRGQITYPGYEHVRWEAVVRAIEPERRFAFTWHPYAVDPKVDYSQEPPTLVAFTLAPVGKATRLEVVETGFENLPSHRRTEAHRMNSFGWEQQLRNIAMHVAHAP